MTFTLWEKKLPKQVVVEGEVLPVYTDFRRWMQLENLLFESKGDFITKIPTILQLCYPELPKTLEQAISGIALFYSGGTTVGKGKGGTQKRLYSFLQDGALIYAGFYQQYGIDLMVEDLHWWQFKALLTGLSEQTKLMKVMHYRAVDTTSLENPEEKRFYRKMKEIYRLPDIRTEEEKEEAISEAISALF